MVAAGITRKRLPAGNDVICTLGDPRVPVLASTIDNTRSAAALELWGAKLEGAVVAIGNAPTALFHLLNLIEAGAPRPAAIVGGPVGFIGAARVEGSPHRTRQRDRSSRSPRPTRRQRDHRGRRQRDCERSRMSAGKLWGVGIGPGDPELVTVKAARVIGEADVVAFHSARHGKSISRGVAAPYMREGQIEEHLVYPVTTETVDHPGGYQGAMDEFYEAAAERLAVHLAAGRTVALLAAGDPLFYSSYMHMHKRLADRFDAEVIPGVTSVSAASAALGKPLVEGEEILTILPGTLPQAELTRRLKETDAAAILKLGRTFPPVLQSLEDSGRLDEAH